MWTARPLLFRQWWTAEQEHNSRLTGTCGQLQAGTDPPGLWGCEEKSVRRGWKPHPLIQLKLIYTKALTAGKSPELAGRGAAGPTQLHHHLFIIYSPNSPYTSLGAASTLHKHKGCRSNTGFPSKSGGDSCGIPVRSRFSRTLACSWPKNIGSKQVYTLNHLHNWLAESRFIKRHFSWLQKGLIICKY